MTDQLLKYNVVVEDVLLSILNMMWKNKKNKNKSKIKI